jgi:hypothetical protein
VETYCFALARYMGRKWKTTHSKSISLRKKETKQKLPIAQYWGSQRYQKNGGIRYFQIIEPFHFENIPFHFERAFCCCFFLKCAIGISNALIVKEFHCPNSGFF